MGDELRQHPATPRRLEKLRQAGVAPSSSAVGGAAALATATAVAAVTWRPVSAGLQTMITQDLQRPATAEELPRLFGQHLLAAGLAVGALAVALAVVAALVQCLASGASVHSPWRSAQPRRQGLRAETPGVVLGLLALVGTAAIYVPRLAAYSEAQQWSELVAGQGWAWLWLRELALLGGLALLHLLWTRAEHLQQARLTRQELRDEQRETEGSWLTKQFTKRRQKGA